MIVKSNSCASCGMCADVCPHDAVTFKKTGGYGTAVITPEKCVNCGKCKEICPKDAITEEVWPNVN